MMLGRTLFLLSFLALAESSRPVHLELYYETLCPDCSGFINQELYPTWRKLRGTNAMTISLYPFGNAREIHQPNGTFSFQCQHGERECLGNMLEVCVIKKMDFNANGYLSILACIENEIRNTDDINGLVAACVRLFQPTKTYEWVRECAEGPEGRRLMHKMATKTNGLNPRHTWVPWIVVNGVHTKDLQEMATTNLLKLICTLYTGPKPYACP